MGSVAENSEPMVNKNSYFLKGKKRQKSKKKCSCDKYIAYLFLTMNYRLHCEGK